MTRAKQNLSIHHNYNLFANIEADNLMSIVDEKNYGPPDKLLMQLSYSDVFLGYFENKQYQIGKLMPGDDLLIVNDGCTNSSGELVLKFSKKYLGTIIHLEDQGYKLKNVKINFIIFWTDPEKGKEFKVILPELNFER